MRLVTLLWLLCWPQLATADTARAIVVLDASGSMWDMLDGRPKETIAREALAAVLQSVPSDAELGLVAYGHREKGNCGDIELVVPPAPGGAAAVGTAAQALNFTGKTPLSAAVDMAAAALDSGRRPASVILITDGVDNCGGDPCALAERLERDGADFTAHVVGFGLSAGDAAAVSCLARITGGSYLQADDLATLTLALQDTVLVASDPRPLPAPPPAPDPNATPAALPDPPAPQPAPAVAEPNFAPHVLLASAGPVLDAAAPVTFVLRTPGATEPLPVTPSSVVPAGDYILETRIGGVIATQPLSVIDGAVARPEVMLNAAEVTFAPRVGAGAGIEPAAQITVTGVFGDKVVLTHPYRTLLAAGDYRVSAQLDAVSASQTLSVAAGQVLQQDIIISAAAIVPKVVYTPGQPVNAADLRIDIVTAAANVDGSRSLIATRQGAAPVFHLGAGDYVAVARLGLAFVEVPFAIALVQRRELQIDLNAGVLAVSAPGADRIAISPPPDIAGNAPELGAVARDRMQETLNAGSYQVSATFGDAVATASVVITPGGRAELALAPP